MRKFFLGFSEEGIYIEIEVIIFDNFVMIFNIMLEEFLYVYVIELV